MRDQLIEAQLAREGAAAAAAEAKAFALQELYEAAERETERQAHAQFLRHVRGEDRTVVIKGLARHVKEGFWFDRPDGGKPVFVAAETMPGSYKLDGLGGPAPFGGPPGDLYLEYTWAIPTRGSDAHYRVTRQLRDRWSPGVVRHPLTGDSLEIPAGWGNEPLIFRGHGLPGQSGGPNGDLIVNIQFEGSPQAKVDRQVNAGRGRLSHALAGGLGALALFAVLLGVFWFFDL